MKIPNSRLFCRFKLFDILIVIEVPVVSDRARNRKLICSLLFAGIEQRHAQFALREVAVLCGRLRQIPALKVRLRMSFFSTLVAQSLLNPQPSSLIYSYRD